MSSQYSGLMHKFMEDIKSGIKDINQVLKRLNTKEKRNSHNIEVNKENIDRLNMILSGKLSIPKFNDEFEESLEETG